jgi:hypothetical protein
LYFNEITGSISILPVTTEVTVLSLNVPVTVGENIKIDYALSLNAVTSANWEFDCEVRLYRDSTLINTRTILRTASQSGTQRFPLADTQVDTAVATGTSTYSLRTFITVATNVSSATAINRDINAIVFP